MMATAASYANPRDYFLYLLISIVRLEQLQPGELKTVVEERIDEQGRKIRATRKIRMRLVQENVSPGIAERRSWKKFGDAFGLKPGPDLASTIIGEPVFLQLTRSKDIDRELVNKTPAMANVKNVACRYCDGPHWSASCPFKATFIDSEKKAEADSEKSGGRPGKYVPPAQRLRDAAAAAAAESGIPIDYSQQDSTDTIKLSNLSDLVVESDVRSLCTPFGPIARCNISRDQYTGRCRGFAFVTFHSSGDAERALTRLNGHLYGNMVLQATWAKVQPPK